MIEIAFLTLYGLALIGGLFMSFVWGRVAYRARCVAQPGPMDQFCWIAIGLTVGSVSNIVIFGLLVSLGLIEGINSKLGQQWWWPVLIFGFLLLGASKWILMWAHSLNRQPAAFRWFAGFSVLWVVLVPLILLGEK